MKTPLILALLSRSLLLGSFSSLVACSSVLQATRLSKSFPQQPAKIVAAVPPESLQDAEAAYGSPIPMLSGYKWVFILKKDAQNSPGYWVVKPND